MLKTLHHPADTLINLWQTTPADTLLKLANTGLNALTARELLTALTHTDPRATLIALLWLTPWHRLAQPTRQLIPTLTTPQVEPRGFPAVESGAPAQSPIAFEIAHGSGAPPRGKGC